MGVTVASATVASHTVEQDEESSIRNSHSGGPATAGALNAAMGTTATLDYIRGEASHFRIAMTSNGTGQAANGAQVVITCSRPPRKIFLANTNASPQWYVGTKSGNTFNLGTAGVPVAATQYVLEVIVIF